MNKIMKFVPHILALFSSLVFMDSLRFKFTNHSNTQEIFGRLNDWAASLGAEGLFAHTGLLSQYVIGGAELLASGFLVLGIIPVWRRLQAVGALIGVAVMTGAVGFHLFTPLTTDPNNDGGGLFIMAVCVWFSCMVLVSIHRKKLRVVIKGIRKALFAA